MTKDELELRVKRLAPGKYESYDMPFRVQDVADIFVDDLRADDDESLNLVPRITTFEHLKATFKLDVDHSLGRDAAKPGDIYWAIIGFYLRTGAATFIPKVLDQSGFPSPPPGVFVFAHWPGAPVMNPSPNPNYHDNAVGGFTNPNGDIGFGYSGGAVVGGGGGVYDIWVSADPPNGMRFFSDMAIRLGWFGGTDHLTPNPIFQAVRKEGAPAPGDNAELRVFDDSGVFVGRVLLSNGQGSGGRIALFDDDQEQAYVNLE